MTDEPGSGSTGPFVAHRSLLFTVAYEILGSAADAEDVVQETWLRWSARFDETGAQAGAEEIRDPRSYLVRIATRQALMDNNGAAAGLAGGVMKDEVAYSPVIGKAVIEAFSATAHAVGSFFPEGSADPALTRRIAELEAHLKEQDEALRRVLTLLVDWVEADGRKPDLSSLRGNAA